MVTPSVAHSLNLVNTPTSTPAAHHPQPPPLPHSPPIPSTPCCLATVVPLDFLYVQADSLKRNFATGTGTQARPPSLFLRSVLQRKMLRYQAGVRGDDRPLTSAVNLQPKPQSYEVQCGVKDKTFRVSSNYKTPCNAIQGRCDTC